MMSIIERLIERYEADDEISVDELLSNYLQDDPECKKLSTAEIVELKRKFLYYCNSAEERNRGKERKGEFQEASIYADMLLLRSERRRHKKFVEAFISNISVTDSLDELYDKYLNGNNVQLLIQDINDEVCTCWSSPRWARRGDIVLFMHAKTARSKLTRVRTELRNTYNLESAKAISLEKAIKEQLDIHKQYGGKIFAVGRINGKPEKYDDMGDTYFNSRVFCDIDDLFLLDTPIDISEFNNFIKVSMQGSITPVFGSPYERLKDIIISKNNVPEYFPYCFSTPYPHSAVNRENWMKLGIEYRNAFTLEAQFRQCYVDYLLSEIGDQKKIFMECACYKSGKPVTFVDNVIRINKSLLPVEVKLNIDLENDLKGQCKQYCMLDKLVLEKKTGREAELCNVINDKVMIIDTYGIYVYRLKSDDIRPLYDLDDLKTKDDIVALREMIIDNMFSHDR